MSDEPGDWESALISAGYVDGRGANRASWRRLAQEVARGHYFPRRVGGAHAPGRGQGRRPCRLDGARRMAGCPDPHLRGSRSDRYPQDRRRPVGRCADPGAVEHHRTPEGDAFAHSVGGETIADDLDIIDECGICSGDLDTDDAPYGY